MSQYINEAFKEYRLIESSEEFALTPEGLDNLGSFMSQALDPDVLEADVIDLEAEAVDELKQSYVGKIICDCNVCHSNIFYNKDEIVIDEEGIVNPEVECPYCMSTDGYTIIGEIKEWDPGLETEIEDEVSEDELADEPIEIEDEEETEVVEEGLKRKSKKRKLTESRKKKLNEAFMPNLTVDEFLALCLDGDCEVKIWDADANAEIFNGYSDELPDSILEASMDGFYASYPQDICVHLGGESFEDITESVRRKRVKRFLESKKKAKECDESLKLDGVEELRGVEELEGVEEVDGVEKLSGVDELSGTEELHESISRDDLENWLGEHETATKDIERFYKKSLDKLSKDEMLDWIEDHKQLSNDMHRYFNESIEDVTITTEDETMTMTTKEDGGVMVETSPREDEEFYDDFDMDVEEDKEEVIAPLSAGTEEEIITNAEEEVPEEETFDEVVPEEEEGFEEFDEETFDELGEAYLRRSYDNIKSFKTSKVSMLENLVNVEGVITFKSGAQKKTNFVFESMKSKTGKYFLEGYNTQITPGKKAFKIRCTAKNKKLIPESLRYNYTDKNELNEDVKIFGVVRSKTLKK